MSESFESAARPRRDSDRVVFRGQEMVVRYKQPQPKKVEQNSVETARKIKGLLNGFFG